MTRAVFQSYAQDDEGNVLPNASVTVIDEDSGSPVSLFNAYSGGSSLPNPFTADANGFFVFYADPARVKITVALGGDTSEFRNVRLSGTAAQADLTSPSATIFDDGNLNYTIFPSYKAENIAIGKVYARSSSLAYLELDTLFLGSRADTMNITSSFKLMEVGSTGSDTPVTSGLVAANFGLNSTRSDRVTRILITGLSGLTINKAYSLFTETITSEIELL